MKKLPVRVWIIAAILFLVGIAHIVSGVLGYGWNWFWIVACIGVAVAYPFVEKAMLTKTEEQKEENQ